MKFEELEETLLKALDEEMVNPFTSIKKHSKKQEEVCCPHKDPDGSIMVLCQRIALAHINVNLIDTYLKLIANNHTSSYVVCSELAKSAINSMDDLDKQLKAIEYLLEV